MAKIKIYYNTSLHGKACRCVLCTPQTPVDDSTVDTDDKTFSTKKVLVFKWINQDLSGNWWVTYEDHSRYVPMLTPLHYQMTVESWNKLKNAREGGD